MIERLLFDGIHRHGGGTAVAKLQQASAFVLADEAEAVLAFADVTVTRTEVAMQTAIGHGLPPTGFMNRWTSCALPSSALIVAPKRAVVCSARSRDVAITEGCANVRSAHAEWNTRDQ